MTILKTKEFILRPIKLSDAESYFELRQDEDTKRNLTSVLNTLEAAKEEIKDKLKEVEEKDSEVFTIEITTNMQAMLFYNTKTGIKCFIEI